jgi:hypothetical protein
MFNKDGCFIESQLAERWPQLSKGRHTILLLGDGLGDASINREIVILRAAMRYVSEMHAAPVPSLSWTKLMRVEAPGRTR